MVDFKKHLAGKKVQKPVDPIALYDTLDRAHDIGSPSASSDRCP